MDNKLISKIKETLKVKDPSLSESELEETSSKIAEKINSKKKVDSDGHIIVAENVKIVLESGISSVTEVKE